METSSFILMALSASTLPLLAVVALLLRRNLFKGKWKVLFLAVGLGLLSFAVIDTFHEHGDELDILDVLLIGGTALITLFILSRFNHTHKHGSELGGAKGIVISEAFHSLIDGAVIGATYLINPLLGYAATLGIITHELPKIVGTVAVLRSLGLSIRQTVTYGTFAQIGSPVAAILVFLLGKQVDHEQFHMLELASVSSLAAIVIWIVYLEVRFHIKHKQSASSEVHEHAD